VKRIPIEQLGRKELGNFARQNGLKAPAYLSNAKIIAMLREHGIHFKEVEDDEAGVGAPQAVAQRQETGFDDSPPARPAARDDTQWRNEALSSAKDPKVRIIIPRVGTDSPDAQTVFVAVNGRAMLLPRGKEIEVPARFVEALRNAVNLEYHMVRLPNNDIEIVKQEVPAIPFSQVM
jgi:hypothetical protein